MFALSTMTVNAESSRQHHAHEHGVAKLDIAVEHNELHIRLNTPAANIIGFEHAPRTSEQKRRLKQAFSQLAKGNTLFYATGNSTCDKQIQTSIESPFSSDHDSHQHHDEHEHHKEHDHHAEEEKHADIVASWKLACSDSKAIQGIKTRLFEYFPALKRLQVQYITEDKQGGTILSPSEPALKF